MLLALFTIAAAAPNSACAQTWDAQGLRDAVEAADGYLVRLDAAGFLAAKNTVMLRLQCVTQPLERDLVGAVHRIVATAAYVEKKEGLVPTALAGLLSADIGYQMPVDLYPEGHPMRDLLPLAALLAQDPASRPLATFGKGWLEVDGVHSYVVSTSRASVVQQVDEQGAVVETRYVWPGDDLGAWNGSVSSLMVDPPAPAVAKKKGARNGLIAGTAAGVVATSVLYGFARSNFDAYNANPSPDLRDSANGFTVAYLVTGAATLGLGVGVAFTW